MPYSSQHRKSVRHWAAEKRRPGTKTTLTTVSELNEGEVPLEGAKDYSASTCSALYSQGREQNEVKTYDTTSETHFLKAPLPNEEEHSTNGTPRPPIPAPRTRIRNKNSASSSEEKAQVDPPRPKIKARSKSVEKPKVNSSLPSPSPIQVTTPDSLLTTNEIDEPPSPGSSHPSMPDMHQPRLPPRPTPSVYKRAKECAKLNNSDCGSVSSWPEYTQHSRPRQKMKKAKSQTHADERFQELRPHRQVVRMRSANDTNEDLYSTRETRTQNQEVGGATGGGENPFSEEMTGQLLKYILASPDPTLKATLKSLITNNEAIKDSLQ